MLQLFLNFFVWWYAVQCTRYLLFVKQVFTFSMYLTNAYPMLKYIEYPLFGDYSFFGRIFGPVVRLVWGIGGIMISSIVIIPFVTVVPLVLLLPFTPILQFLLLTS